MPVATPGEGPGGPARPLILEQTAARRAEKNFLLPSKIKSVLHVQSCFLVIRPTDFVSLFLLPSPHDRILFE